MRKQRPINVFVDASPLAEKNITGIPHFTAELVRGLSRHPDHGKKFQIVLLIAWDKRPQLNRWNYESVKYRIVPLPMRGFNLIWKYNLLPPLDIIYGKGVYLFPNYKNWPTLFSPSLTYIHDLGFIRYPEFVQPKNLAFLRANIHRWVRRATVLLTGSEHAKQEIVELLKVPEEKVVSIYHGVDMHEYYPRTEQEIEATKRHYAIQGQYIMYMGSLEPRKNLIRLVRAYKALPDAQRKAYGLLLVGGGGWLNDELLAEIKQAQEDGYNIIRPNSYVADADIPILMSGAVLLVHPALYEGFGLPPLQAMACGTPVLVADNSSLPEVVGKAGMLFYAEDETDMSAKIVAIVTDKALRTQMCKLGEAQAAKFSWRIAADQLATVIESTMK